MCLTQHLAGHPPSLPQSSSGPLKRSDPGTFPSQNAFQMTMASLLYSRHMSPTPGHHGTPSCYRTQQSHSTPYMAMSNQYVTRGRMQMMLQTFSKALQQENVSMCSKFGPHVVMTLRWFHHSGAHLINGLTHFEFIAEWIIGRARSPRACC